MLQPIIRELDEKKLIGISMRMSFADYRIADLWKSFRPRVHMIEGKTNNDLVSLALYQDGQFDVYNPQMEFERWALVETDQVERLPDGMSVFVIPRGLYAVFNYKGINTDTGIFKYIYAEWLPGSSYVLDQRPHFEILGEKYRNNDPLSEEEIWIPIKKKQ